MVHFPPKKLWVNFLFVKKHQTGGWGGRGRLGKSPHFPKEDLFGKTPLFPMFEFSVQSFGHETKLFPVGGSIVQVTFVSWHHCIVFIFFCLLLSFLVRRLWLNLKPETSLQMLTSGKEAGSLDSKNLME